MLSSSLQSRNKLIRIQNQELNLIIKVRWLKRPVAGICCWSCPSIYTLFMHTCAQVALG